MPDKVMGSYLYELKPYVDKKKWKSASGDIESALKSKSEISYEEWKGRKKSLIDDVKEAAKLKGEIEKLEAAAKNATGSRLADINKILGHRSDEDKNGIRSGLKGELEEILERISTKRTQLEYGSTPDSRQMIAGKMSSFTGWIGKASAAVIAYYEAMKKAITGAMELVDSQKELANKLNPMGAFGSMSTRDLMARYGISSNKAVAMSTTLSMMGLSESDIGRMTKAQRKTYNELIQYYQQGINKIDTKKLKEYYSTMEDYQTKQAMWKMDIQTTILKMVAESNGFTRLVGSLEKFFEKTIDFLESPILQWGFDALTSFLSEVVDLSANFISIFGAKGISSNSKTVNSNSVNNYYIYGSENASSEDIAKKVALRQSNPSFY